MKYLVFVAMATLSVNAAAETVMTDGALTCVLVTPNAQLVENRVITPPETKITYTVAGSGLEFKGVYNSQLNSTDVSIRDVNTGIEALSTDWAHPADSKQSSGTVIFTKANGDCYILQCLTNL